MPLMSMSISGCASRSFIIGIRLWPPARILAPGAYLASRLSAWPTVAAFSYSTCAGTCTHASRGARAPFVLFERLRNLILLVLVMTSHQAGTAKEQGSGLMPYVLTVGRCYGSSCGDDAHAGVCDDPDAAERVRSGGQARVGPRRRHRARRQRVGGLPGDHRPAPGSRRPADHPQPGR